MILPVARGFDQEQTRSAVRVFKTIWAPPPQPPQLSQYAHCPATRPHEHKYYPLEYRTMVLISNNFSIQAQQKEGAWKFSERTTHPPSHRSHSAKRCIQSSMYISMGDTIPRTPLFNPEIWLEWVLSREMPFPIMTNKPAFPFHLEWNVVDPRYQKASSSTTTPIFDQSPSFWTILSETNPSKRSMMKKKKQTL